MSSEYVSFLDQNFLRSDLSDTVLNYIDTYNRVVQNPAQLSPDNNDYDFRMNQALQMFGNSVVTDAIQLIIINAQNND